ncbi:MAG: permease prefix domain 1-containing protein [Micropruina sp.]|uniref:permease prefix domain 1-containing protein n=1 Tax=Micropruina sp. TaxID=2737536 RepID=UPI0039E4B1A6
MTDPIADYCRVVRRGLVGVTDVDEVVAEVEDHLRETADALAASGSTPDDAALEAVRRFGAPGAVVGGLRAQHGYPRGRDPAPVSRSIFTLAAGLLMLAAGAAAVAIYLHWLPCGGDAITTDTIQDACLTRMDTSWAFPFAPEAGERSPAADLFRLAGLLLLVLTGATLGLGQPWCRRVRWAILAPVLPILAMAADTVWLILDPSTDPHLGIAAALPLDVLIGVGLAAVATVIAPLDEGSGGWVRNMPGQAPISYTAAQWRAALLLLGMSAPSFTHAVAEYMVMIGLSDLNWDTPPGTGYLTAGWIAACAIVSLLVGLFARPPVTLDEYAAQARAEPAELAIPGGAQ